jgi:ketosteroid isomerase-like protein
MKCEVRAMGSAVEADVAAIHSLAAEWSAAVREGRVADLADLMTDDIVVIHDDGRVVEGRPAVLEDLERAFALVRVEQVVESEETIVAGDWAFDRARVVSRLAAFRGGVVHTVASRTVTILQRDGRSGAWRMARTIGVIERDG